MQELITVADRIEGNTVVCIDDNTMTVRHLSHIDYPFIAEGDVLKILLDGETVTRITPLKDETIRRKEEMSTQLHKLFSRSKKK